MFVQKIVAIIIFIFPTYVFAKDLGNYGQVFIIKEQGFLEMINEKMNKLDMEKLNKEMQEKAKEKIMHPKAIFGIVPATKTKIFYYDPSFVLAEDIVLPCGTIVHRAGTSVNPLKYMTLERELVFVDAREKRQIAWLKGKLKNQYVTQGEVNDNRDGGSALVYVNNNQQQVRIILVGGSVFALEEELQEFSEEIKDQVYFDQDGALVHKFGITHSPAVVVQEGEKLKILEIYIQEGGI